MAEDEYKDYHGKEVSLLIDARAFARVGENLHSEVSNTSMCLIAKVMGETEKHLVLEEVVVNNFGVLNEDDNNAEFKRGMINKQYVIGIFEEPVRDEETSETEEEEEQ